MKTLFLDIETAPSYRTYEDLPEDGKLSFKKKFGYKVESGHYMDIAAAYDAEAALYAEYSQIICICISTISKNKEGVETMFLKAFTGFEVDILKNFKVALEKFDPTTICAHRGKVFDFPFIGRRMIIHGIVLPNILNVGGKKPWDVNWECTAEMWSFTDRHHHVSLITLAYIFGIPSPKQTMDGAMVPTAFYQGRIADIKNYCIEDVVTLVMIYLRIKGLPVVTEKKILE